jgi:hypothetical protein
MRVPMNVPGGRTLVGALAVMASLAAAPAAHAGVLVSSAPKCEVQSSTRPFLRWLDPLPYTPVPGGAAESADGWKLTGGATIATGNEPWKVQAAGDSRSVLLPPRSSATTRSICVGILHPTLRFFVSGGDLLSFVRVEVLYEDVLGAVHSVTIGRTLLGGGWRPTLPMPVLVNLLALLPGDRTAVAFRFTAQGAATFRIDDLYVDPYSRG